MTSCPELRQQATEATWLPFSEIIGFSVSAIQKHRGYAKRIVPFPILLFLWLAQATAFAAAFLDDKGETVREFPVGPGLCALAVGDVDQMPGEELITLHAGWIRIWDPESGVELLRFRVGNDQKGLAVGQ